MPSSVTSSSTPSSSTSSLALAGGPIATSIPSIAAQNSLSTDNPARLIRPSLQLPGCSSYFEFTPSSPSSSSGSPTSSRDDEEDKPGSLLITIMYPNVAKITHQLQGSASFRPLSSPSSPSSDKSEKADEKAGNYKMQFRADPSLPEKYSSERVTDKIARDQEWLDMFRGYGGVEVRIADDGSEFSLAE